MVCMGVSFYLFLSGDEVPVVHQPGFQLLRDLHLHLHTVSEHLLLYTDTLIISMGVWEQQCLSFISSVQGSVENISQKHKHIKLQGFTATVYDRDFWRVKFKRIKVLITVQIGT